MRQCIRCNSAVADGDMFCVVCGTKQSSGHEVIRKLQNNSRTIDKVKESKIAKSSYMWPLIIFVAIMLIGPLVYVLTLQYINKREKSTPIIENSITTKSDSIDKYADASTLNSSGTVLNTLKMAHLYVPNALPGREEESQDGVTYTKTANTANSTAFQIITIDPVNYIIYAHHYGAGIDVILHYDSQSVSSSTTLTSSLASPSWASNDTDIAIVSSGVVTPVASGDTMIWAKSETDNCVEAWNLRVTV